MATTLFSLALWLFMAAAEISTPLHSWLHGGAIPENDNDCAIVAIAHGKVEAVTSGAPAVVAVTWIEIYPCLKFSDFLPSRVCLPDGRGPPVLPAVS